MVHNAERPLEDSSSSLHHYLIQTYDRKGKKTPKHPLLQFHNIWAKCDKYNLENIVMYVGKKADYL